MTTADRDRNPPMDYFQIRATLIRALKKRRALKTRKKWSVEVSPEVYRMLKNDWIYYECNVVTFDNNPITPCPKLKGLDCKVAGELIPSDPQFLFEYELRRAIRCGYIPTLLERILL